MFNGIKGNIQKAINWAASSNETTLDSAETIDEGKGKSTKEGKRPRQQSNEEPEQLFKSPEPQITPQQKDKMCAEHFYQLYGKAQEFADENYKLKIENNQLGKQIQEYKGQISQLEDKNHKFANQIPESEKEAQQSVNQISKPEKKTKKSSKFEKLSYQIIHERNLYRRRSFDYSKQNVKLAKENIFLRKKSEGLLDINHTQNQELVKLEDPDNIKKTPSLIPTNDSAAIISSSPTQAQENIEECTLWMLSENNTDTDFSKYVDAGYRLENIKIVEFSAHIKLAKIVFFSKDGDIITRQEEPENKIRFYDRYTNYSYTTANNAINRFHYHYYDNLEGRHSGKQINEWVRVSGATNKNYIIKKDDAIRLGCVEYARVSYKDLIEKKIIDITPNKENNKYYLSYQTPSQKPKIIELESNDSTIEHITFSSDNNLILAVCSNLDIIIWDARDFTEKDINSENRKKLSCIIGKGFAAENNIIYIDHGYLAIVYKNNILKIWDIYARKYQFMVAPGDKEISDIRFIRNTEKNKISLTILTKDKDFYEINFNPSLITSEQAKISVLPDFPPPNEMQNQSSAEDTSEDNKLA